MGFRVFIELKYLLKCKVNSAKITLKALTVNDPECFCIDLSPSAMWRASKSHEIVMLAFKKTPGRAVKLQSYRLLGWRWPVAK